MHVLKHYLKSWLPTIPLVLLFSLTAFAQGDDAANEVPDSLVKACYAKDTKAYFNCLDGLLEDYPSLYTQGAVLNAKGKRLLRTGKYEQCYEIAKEGLAVANKQDNNINRGVFYNLQGASKQMQGDLREAIDKYIKAATVLEEMGDTLRAAITKGNVGNLYFDLKDYDNAQKYIAEAIEGVTRYNDSVNLSNILSIQATLQLKTGDTLQALHHSRRALALSNSVNNVIGKLSSMVTLAEILYTQQKVDSSIYYYEQVDGIATQVGLNYFNLLAKTGMVRAYTTKRNYRQATAIGKEALTLPIGNEHRSNLEKLYRHYAMALYHTGAYADAYEYLDRSYQISDSILSSENKEIVNNITAKYETVKKDKKLAQNELMLQQQSQLIYERNVYVTGLIVAVVILLLVVVIVRMRNRYKLKELDEQKRIQVLQAQVSGEEKERVRIAKELHDGVANELAVIKMYLENLPKGAVEASANERLSKIAGIAANAHTELRRVSHNLYPVKLLSKGWADAVEDYLHTINDSYGKLDINITKLSELNLPKAQQLLAFRLVQEMMGNAIKHSNASTITVAVLLSAEQLSITVEDDGVGIPKVVLEDNSKFVTIREHVSVLEGILEIDSTEGRGTSIMVTIPNKA